MDFLNVGKYTTTHGLKGEIKIISNVNNSSTIFNVGNTIYIGDDKLPFEITSYRKHQKYDMIILKDLGTLEKVLPFKGKNIYINKDEFKDVLKDDLVDFEVYNNDVMIGRVVEILKGVKYDMIVVGDERIIIPFIDNFIVLVDKESKIIKTSYMI